METFDDLKQGYIRIIDKIIDIVPYKKMNSWKEFFFEPLSAVKNSNKVVERLKDVYVYELINLVLLIVTILPPLIVLGFMGALGSYLTLY
ncbi:hypothetical protein HZC07_02025 [Candidatus Micrarchaeota archaeon]|nr:hypothetical protein [Candidatus Micrarchaeota archaeon]